MLLWLVLTVPSSELFKFRSLFETQINCYSNFSEKVALVNSIPNFVNILALVHSIELWDEERQPRLKVWSINIVYNKVTFLNLVFIICFYVILVYILWFWTYTCKYYKVWDEARCCIWKVGVWLINFAIYTQHVSVITVQNM